MRKFLVLAAALAALTTAPVAFATGNDVRSNANPHNKVGICHATGSETNPFVYIEPNANGVVDGHADHQDDRDIIPAFTYREHGEQKSFPGQNLETSYNGLKGGDILKDRCRVPAKPTPSCGETNTCPGTPAAPADKVEICHATGSEKNPYVRISPNASGVYNGHMGSDHQDGRDIIPPFRYDANGNGAVDAGETFSQNWDARGQAIFNNGCETTAPSHGDPPACGGQPSCPPAADVCPNLAGHQSSVPAGYVKDAQGNCVCPPPTLTAPTSTQTAAVATATGSGPTADRPTGNQSESATKSKKKTKKAPTAKKRKVKAKKRKVAAKKRKATKRKAKVRRAKATRRQRPAARTTRRPRALPFTP